MNTIKDLWNNTSPITSDIWRKKKQEMINPRMYIILREDLSYKYIQGQHALAQFAFDHYDDFVEWGNEYVINLSVFNGLALAELIDELTDKGLHKFSAFMEPDLKSELYTAVCIFENGEGKVKDALSGCGLATK